MALTVGLRWGKLPYLRGTINSYLAADGDDERDKFDLVIFITERNATNIKRIEDMVSSSCQIDTGDASTDHEDVAGGGSIWKDKDA